MNHFLLYWKVYVLMELAVNFVNEDWHCFFLEEDVN